VVGVWDETSVSIYINGVNQTGTVLSAGTSDGMTSSTEPVRIGLQNPGNYFNGTIDEMRMNKRTLTAEEIQEHYKKIAKFQIVSTYQGIGKVFNKVFGEHFAGESFTALESSLRTVSIWLVEPNDDELLVQILEGSVNGKVLATVALSAGKTGKRTVRFSPPVILKKGGVYCLKVSSGAPGTTTGAVEQQTPNPVLKGFTETGESRYDMAMELLFQPHKAAVSSPIAKKPKPAPKEKPKTAEDLAYEESLWEALSQKRDVWGDKLIALPEGPTYENIVNYLNPIMFCGDYVTTSGVYYLVFGDAKSLIGGGDCALHVGDGSEIKSRRMEGRKTTFFVGVDGGERFGSNLDRLKEPKLFNGYQPILVSDYTDKEGILYHQESFATYIPETKSLVSFIRLAARPQSENQKHALFKIKFSDRGLSIKDNCLVKAGKTYICFPAGADADYEEPYLTFRMDMQKSKETVIHFIRVNQPAKCMNFLPSEKRFLEERRKVCQYWDKLLAEGARFEVPEKRVMDAMRSLLIQNLFMGWRYSIGNAYEGWYASESHRPLKVLGEYGFLERYKANLQYLLSQKEKGYKTVEFRRRAYAEKMFGAVRYYFMTRNRSFIEENRKVYNTYMDEYLATMEESPNGIFPKVRYSGDIPGKAYCLHYQAMAWRGMRDMALVYDLLGFEEAEKFARGADKLKAALIKAIDASKTEMDDGSLFIPVRLFESVKPYDHITKNRIGSYWNLVAWHGFSTGIIPFRSQEMEKILHYMFNHGSRFLGLTRFNYRGFAIGYYDKNGLPGYRSTGADNVYGVKVINILAEQDEADQMVLSLYGKLAHGMTRGTFIASEGDSFDPPERYRSLYLPPNLTNNALFLKILHDMLIYNPLGERGNPEELLLAHSTPRAWLEDGKEIRVTEAPTLFGAVSFHIRSYLKRNRIEVDILTPNREQPKSFILRLRTPYKQEIRKVVLNGEWYKKFDVSEETIDLSGHKGMLKLIVYYKKGEII
jgi:hypothetical protein